MGVNAEPSLPGSSACLSAHIETVGCPKTTGMGTGSGGQLAPHLNEQGLGRWGITDQGEMFAVVNVPGALNRLYPTEIDRQSLQRVIQDLLTSIELPLVHGLHKA